MTDRVVTIPEHIICTLCSSVVPDEADCDAHVLGRQQEDEYFLLLICAACSGHTLVMDGGDA